MFFDAKALSHGATLQKGAIAMVLRKLAASPGDELRFSVRTSTAVAGVRGTCNGAIHLQSEGSSMTKDLASSHHQEVRVTRSASGISVDSAPLLYHTDGDVEAIAARIGEKIDWTRIDR
jgi:hypothetical protein